MKPNLKPSQEIKNIAYNLRDDLKDHNTLDLVSPNIFDIGIEIMAIKQYLDKYHSNT